MARLCRALVIELAPGLALVPMLAPGLALVPMLTPGLALAPVLAPGLALVLVPTVAGRGEDMDIERYVSMLDDGCSS